MIEEINIPKKLTSLPQWVVWKESPRANGKAGKIPFDPRTGGPASVINQHTWSSLSRAIETSRSLKNVAGIGFVFTDKDPFVGIDLDDCLDDSGKLLPWAADLVESINSYTEISPSGRGVHIITEGVLPDNRRSKGIEMYGSERFFTVTGKHLAGTPEEITPTNLTAVYESFFASPKPERDSISTESTTDRALIEQACQAVNGDKFRRLWKGDFSGYPSQSEADLAFCKMLSYWTDSNREQMLRIFNQSGLSRSKWQGAGGGLSDYAESTITKALSPDEPVLISHGKPAAESFNLTDLGNAERMAAKFGDMTRYCFKKKCWYIWDGQRWAEDGNNLIMQKAKLVVRDIYNEAAAAGNYEKRQALVKHACKSEAEHKMAAMVSLARNEAGIPVAPEELDQNPWLLNCLNGTLDLKTGQLQPHRRSDLITRLVPVAYNPEAPCPLWEKFLDRVMDGNQELITFLQRAIGYSLTGDTSEQSMIILYGSGANGKSTFLETISEMLRDYAMHTPTETLLVKGKGAMSNDVARLKGARFVTASEAEFGQRLAEGLIKQMTGQDTLSARFLHQEYVDFRPTHKIFLGTNHKPIIRGNEHAIWRRIKLVPFEVTIPAEERDRNLPIRLQGELPGILAWAVRGCLDWRESGLGDPEAVKKATNSYRDEMDVFNDFMNDCCLIDDSFRVSSKELYAAYSKWCTDNGERPLGRIALAGRFKDQGFKSIRFGKSGGRVWQGLGLSSPN
jgi:putative DNA primase/helicase